MKLKTSVAIVALTALLSACGGGGGSSGTSAFGNTSSSTTTTTTATNVTSNTSGSVVLSLTSSTISASQPATVTAVVKDSSGAPIAGALVQFAITGSTSTIAQLSPASAITDANGQAAATLTPATGATSGAAYVSASADTAAGTLTAKSAFSVSATNVILNSVAVVPGSISAYGSSSVNIGVTGASSTNPVTVNISSTCATGGKATISPSTLTLTGATGTVTYQDKACSATDRINVQIAGTTQQQSADLIVAAPATQSIQYSSVDNANICLLGTGCPSVANVVFKVVNVSGAGQSGERVDFSLDSASSNFADLGSQFGTTAVDGTVTVSVASRQTPTPLRVTAKLHSNAAIQTVSNVLTISGGLPVAGLTENHTGISFAASKYALNYNVDGDFADLTLRLTDRYGAGAVDGTAVSLVSDGGTVVPAYCVTKDGTCGVKLYVTNPRPTNGRVHILAYAKGQEYFVDTNGNGTFDVGTETVYDDVPV
ncbi:Ig-like domain-containing protein, partial [Aquabacterium sp.]|uniref:Ig-like domain-containing protein n=1 Tax=Aquabacterium sp. TaxID=1872578 RepID=UPI0025BE6B67